MEPGFFSRPLGLWLATLGVAALLLGLGYEAAHHALGPQLVEARKQLAEQTTRANRLAAETQSLETRLAQASAQLEARGLAPREPPEPPEAEGARSRALHRGEAAVLLDGKLVIHLEALLVNPRRAVVRVKVVGGQESTAVLTAGGEARFKLEGQEYVLVVRRIVTSSIIFTLAPAGQG